LKNWIWRVMDMEQKPVDDLDESYFGEEFIDEELLSEKAKSTRVDRVDDDITIEAVESKPKVKRKPVLRKAAKTIDESLIVDNKYFSTANEGSKNATPQKESSRVEQGSGKAAVKPPTSKADDSLKPKIEILPESSASFSSAKAEHAAEARTPIDPFKPERASKKSGNGPLADVSTWKTITGIALILLIFSVFTQGFHFTGDAAGKTELTGKEITKEEAEWRVLQYVNEQLLEPPFLATSEGSGVAGPLYQILLNIGGENVVSYVTKDGRYFFPQGIDISFFVSVKPVTDDKSELDDLAANKDGQDDAGAPNADDVKNDESGDPIDPGSTVNNDDADNSNPKNILPEPAAADSAVSVTLTAKKWLFSPHQIVVKEGQMVTLNIEPENLEFTFSIPELGIEKEISGPTAIELKPARKGSFPFTCSSCEEWRGMSGMLIVE